MKRVNPEQTHARRPAADEPRHECTATVPRPAASGPASILVEAPVAGGAPAHPRWHALFTGSRWIALRVGTDVLMLVCACVAALALAPGDAASAATASPWLLTLFPALALLALESGGRYRRRMRDAALESTGQAFGAISLAAMSVLALMLVAGSHPGASGSLVAWTWLAALSGVTATATALVAGQRSLRRRGHVVRAALIVGTDPTGVAMAARLARLPQYGLRAVGFLDADRARVPPPGAPPLLGGLEDLAEIAARHGVRTVILCFPDAPHDELLELIARCDGLGLETTIVPRMSAAVNSQTRFEYLGVQPLLNLRAVDREGWRFELKHGLDRVLAGVVIVALAPLLGLLALLVRITSPGPVLFRQARTGRDGRVFELLKFRTMIEPTEAAVYALYPDLAPRGMAPGGVEGVDRRTRVGRLLRRTSLDELPQLVNVLRGEMSLVGPRPERPEFAELFRHEVERYHDRHRVRAGMTGWAQVHGLRGQTPLAERVELDNFYIEHWSLALDAKIMLLTVPALLRGS